MDNIVYLLGAGFSAPLGLPTINDFLIKSKDMFFENPTQYKYFQQVFDTITDMSVCKNYYGTDLFNVEEILSILEMGKYLEGKSLQELFLRYIADVIRFYTPNLKPYPKDLPGNWHDFIFGQSDLWTYYGFFIGSVHNLSIASHIVDGQSKSFRKLRFTRDPNPKAHYSIITLNYDLIPEIVCQYMSDDNNTISFATELAEYKDTNQGKAALAKLHGSIDKENIVAPTWNKGGVNSKVLSAWKLAHDVLIEANHLRILGYSLPEGDAYIRYLLKSAAIKSPHLKSIDVICLESTDSVRKRYEEFIRFKYFRFMNANIIEYLRKNRDLGRAGRRETSPGSGSISLNKLEDSHNSFMVNE